MVLFRLRHFLGQSFLSLMIRIIHGQKYTDKRNKKNNDMKETENMKEKFKILKETIQTVKELEESEDVLEYEEGEDGPEAQAYADVQEALNDFMESIAGNTDVLTLDEVEAVLKEALEAIENPTIYMDTYAEIVKDLIRDEIINEKKMMKTGILSGPLCPESCTLILFKIYWQSEDEAEVIQALTQRLKQ